MCSSLVKRCPIMEQVGNIVWVEALEIALWERAVITNSPLVNKLK
jgi:hypothetical protein